MKPLRDVIQALRAEIATALAMPGDRGVPLHPTRAVVTLRVLIRETGAESPPFEFIAAADRDGNDLADTATHTVTIEFEREPAGTAFAREQQQSGLAVPGVAAGHSPASGASLTQSLTTIFGAPGFDNAARATVFREVVDALTPEQIVALGDSFAREPEEVPRQKPAEAAVGTARLRITRLLKLGPGGFPEGRPALVELLRNHRVSDIRRALQEQWKTQSEWAREEGQGGGGSRQNPPSR